MSRIRILLVKFHDRNNMKEELLLDAAPGPSPWYLRGKLGPAPPSGYVWMPAPSDEKATAGVTLLKNQADVVMFVDYYNYVSALSRDSLLIWHQQPGQNPSAPVVLRGYRYTDLLGLNAPVEELCALMRARGLPVLTNSRPTFECAWPTTIVDEFVEVQVPEQLEYRDEFLILCSSSAIQRGPGHGHLALMVASPVEGRIKLYPQDWLNDGQVDLGYQWVTRVARDPRTHSVHGDGIRIGPFVLDETLRNPVRQ